MKKLFFLATALTGLICGHSQQKSSATNTSDYLSLELGSVESDALEKKDTTNIRNDGSRPYALVAGGSKGIGYAIAEALAKRGYDLVLIARHADSLIAAKNKLESSYKIHVEILSFDLSQDGSAIEIAKWCTERDIPLKMLCNVAGFGGARDYLSLPLDTLRYMINLNIGSAMSLTLTLLPLCTNPCKKFIFCY
jgi:uncharacterized protein